MPSPPSFTSGAVPDAGLGFPETQTSVLAQAAAGNWEPFFRSYLAPCWREITLACRGRVPIDDVGDLFQELTVRLLRVGRSRAETESSGHTLHGNIPQRYLARKQLGIPSARFRTYLKQIILNLIREHSRKLRRDAKSLDLTDAIDAVFEGSVESAVDRYWVAACLADAAKQFREQSLRARTKARKRQFDLLYQATVHGLSPSDLSRKWGLHRTTITVELGEAREGFVKLLSGLTGVADREELKRYVAADPCQLFDALENSSRADAVR